MKNQNLFSLEERLKDAKGFGDFVKECYDKYAKKAVLVGLGSIVLSVGSGCMTGYRIIKGKNVKWYHPVIDAAVLYGIHSNQKDKDDDSPLGAGGTNPPYNPDSGPGDDGDQDGGNWNKGPDGLDFEKSGEDDGIDYIGYEAKYYETKYYETK